MISFSLKGTDAQKLLGNIHFNHHFTQPCVPLSKTKAFNCLRALTRASLRRKGSSTRWRRLQWWASCAGCASGPALCCSCRCAAASSDPGSDRRRCSPLKKSNQMFKLFFARGRKVRLKIIFRMWTFGIKSSDVILSNCALWCRKVEQSTSNHCSMAWRYLLMNPFYITLEGKRLLFLTATPKELMYY